MHNLLICLLIVALHVCKLFSNPVENSWIQVFTCFSTYPNITV